MEGGSGGSGGKYEGEFKDDAYHGKGIMTYEMELYIKVRGNIKQWLVMVSKNILPAISIKEI